MRHKQTNLGFSSSSFLSALNLPVDVGLEACLMELPLCHRVVLAQNVHQVSDIAGRQTQGLDLGQFGVGRNVWDAAAQRRERRVDAVRASTLFTIRTHSLLHHSSTSWNDLTRLCDSGGRQHGGQCDVVRASCAQVVVVWS